jgi:hypothetical protein
MADLEADIDRLYQLPLEEFTPARNALARERKAPELKKLEKPGVAAWAVNQVYWRHRATWDRLAASAEALRAEHRKLLGGRQADIRSAEAAHREAVRAAVEKTRELLARAGHAPSPATMAAVQETLESLPSEERPGRLTRPLKPRGFEALAGMPARPARRVVHPPPRESREARAGRGHGDELSRTARRGAGAGRGERTGDAEVRTRAKEDARVRMLEARRRAQLAREQERRRREAQKALAKAQAAMLRAEQEVRRAEKELAARRARRDQAVAAYEQARRRAHE